MAESIRILIIEDHALLRRALSEWLGREPDFTVVGRAATAQDAIQEVRRCSPDVILIDIDMPGLNCFDAVRRILSIRPSLRVVFVSTFVQDRYLEQALARNVNGYLTKRDPPETVVAAIREAATGGTYFSDDIQSRIVVLRKDPMQPSVMTSRVSLLTVRQIEVLRYIASGLAQKRIASIMSLSVKTVDNHCTNLMKKLDIHDRVELTRFAIREGLAEA